MSPAIAHAARFGVIVATSQLPFARVLAQAIETHHGGTLTALVLDARSESPVTEPFDVLRLTDLPGSGDPRLLALPRRALARLVRPRFVRRLLDEGGAVVLLEPESDVLAPLDDLLAAAHEHGAVLVPRLLEPLADDGQAPSQQEVLAGGLYESGVMAFGPGGDADRLLRWWTEQEDRVVDEDTDDPEDDEDEEEAPALQFAPALLPGLCVLRDPGYGVAYWNLPGRPLGEGPTAAGAALRTLYLPGFDPLRPHWLSDGNSRVRVTTAPVLERLLASYAERLLAAGYEEAVRTPWGSAELPNGIAMTPALRRLLLDALAEGAIAGDPFTASGTSAFMRWLNEPAETGGGSGVTRYLLDVYRRRVDLQEAFPRLDGDDGDAFIHWARSSGRAEEEIPEALLPPVLDPTGREPRVLLGVNVAGYLSGGLGLGEAARLYVNALGAAGIPVHTESVDPPLPPAQTRFGVRAARKRLAFEEVDSPVEFPLNLVCVNPPELPGFIRRIGDEFFAGRKTIGVWGWETSFLPESWFDAFEHMDEVWTYTSYTAAVLGQRAPVPVVAVPLPVTAPPEPPPLELELPPGFVFLFAFDFFSTIQRKNPLGLVAAFKRAFAEGEGPHLVLKSFNGDYKPEHLERLRQAAGGRADIHIIDRFLPAGQRDALMARADCYVSLHRAEGFGLTMAEAMAMGKPVIATGYSGNLDFMDPGCAYLVDYELTTVGPGIDIYPEDGIWAEPSVDHAAALMRRVVERPDEAAERGGRARERIERELSPAACGAIARRRLELLAEQHAREEASRREDAPKEWPALRLAALQAGYDPLGQLTASPRDVARRAVLQALRPYSVSQHELDERLLAAMRELHERVDGVVHPPEFEERTAALGRRARRAEWHSRRQSARAAALEQRLSELESRLSVLVEQRDDLDRLISGARARPASTHPAITDRSGALAFGSWNAAAASDGYAGFEDIFRGAETEVTGRQRWYVARLHGPVLDIGCGRGELLELLREAGIAASGIDADPSMVERCKDKGLDVVRADAVAHLEATAVGSLGAITALQVAEHLPADTLATLLDLARSRLEPGGTLILETVNPHVPSALKAFWTDPTHQHPLFPETLLALCRLAGFSSGQVLFPGGGQQPFDLEIYERPDYAVVATA